MMGAACVQVAFNLGNAIGAYAGGPVSYTHLQLLSLFSQDFHLLTHVYQVLLQYLERLSLIHI